MEHRLIDINSASEYLGISKATLYTWTSRKLIPYVKIRGKLIRFDIKDLEKWIEDKRIAAVNVEKFISSH